MKQPPRRKLRSACDFCHRSKIRCSGGTPCAKCRTRCVSLRMSIVHHKELTCHSDMQCQYSYMEQLGKPRGSRNKKTIENAGTSTTTDVGSWSMVGQGSRDGTQTLQPDYQAEDVQDCQDSDLLAYLNFSSEVGMLDTNAPDWNQSDTSYMMQPCTDVTTVIANDIEDGPANNPSGTLTPHRDVAHELFCDKASRQDHSYAAVDGNASKILATASAPVEVQDRSGLSCDCLQIFGNHISRLDRVERQSSVIRIDQSFHNTSLISISMGEALECPSCRLNPRVLLLVTMALGTMLSWLHEGCKQPSHDSTLPPVQFGCWRLSQADTLLTRNLLLGRIVTESRSSVETLRTRVEELSRDASKSSIRHGFVAGNTLQEALCRVDDVVDGLAQSIAT